MNLRSASGTVLIGTVALLIIALLSWLLLISPLLGDISEAKDATAAAVDSNQVLTAQVAALEKQAGELTKMRNVADQLEQVFPATADQPGFFAAINKAASHAGIPAGMVTTLSPTAPQLLDAAGDPVTTTTSAAPTAETADTTGTTAPVAGVDLAEQTVAVTVEGSFEQIQKLLTNLEAMPRAFVVTSLGVTSGATDSGTPEGGSPSASTLTVSITGSTFVAPPLDYPELKDGGSPESTG